MSDFAVFQLISTDRLAELREIWPNTFKYLDKHAKRYFDDSGYSAFSLCALIRYLKAKKSIDLTKSYYNLLFPNAYEESVFFLDKKLNDEYAELLEPSIFSGKERKAMLRELFDKPSPGQEKVLIDGLNILKQSLELVTDRSLMIVQIVY